MSGNLQRWEKYKRSLEMRATKDPIQWVLLTSCFAFMTGVNTVCTLFGGYFLHPFSVVIALYAVATSLIVTALAGTAVVMSLRQRPNAADPIAKR
jgi:uncharacterized integral membrane protein